MDLNCFLRWAMWPMGPLFSIKVFRLNGRPYCYSSVSFSLLLLRSSVSNGRPYCYSSVSFSLLLRSFVSNGRPYCYSFVSFSLLLFFFLWFFLPISRKRFWSIFMKFSGLIVNHKNLIYFFLFWWRHFRFGVFPYFLVFRGCCCPDFFSESITDR